MGFRAAALSVVIFLEKLFLLLAYIGQFATIIIIVTSPTVGICIRMSIAVIPTVTADSLAKRCE